MVDITTCQVMPPITMASQMVLIRVIFFPFLFACKHANKIIQVLSDKDTLCCIYDRSSVIPALNDTLPFDTCSFWYVSNSGYIFAHSVHICYICSHAPLPQQAILWATSAQLHIKLSNCITQPLVQPPYVCSSSLPPLVCIYVTVLIFSVLPYY